MSIKIAINGYGRIGKCLLRLIIEAQNGLNELELVAVNDSGVDCDIHAHLTQYDTVHGYFNHEVKALPDGLSIDGKKIRFFSTRDPNTLPWATLGVDIVLECTGAFTSKEKSMAHINAGAKKVLISAPGATDVDATIVYGVNHHLFTKDMQVISNASCTTNCLAPLIKVLQDTVGIESGLMTTVHSYTRDQALVDSYHKDLHRARSAAMSIIPTKTGAAKSVGLIFPELKGKLDGVSVRVPTPNVSLVDLSIIAKRDTTVEEINNSMIFASQSSLNGILAINTLPLVSSDFNNKTYSSIFDATQTKVIGRLVKVFSWYDNEWGFASRMLDMVKLMNK